MFSRLLLGAAAVTSVRAASSSFPAGVIATGTQGVTNPPAPTAPTTINQTSMARLLSINSIDDFCIFAPPQLNDIADTETEEVAWCTQPRNNARVIPDGTITGVSFLKTDFYVQVFGYGDFTKLNIISGDEGGELDPHGATGAGNPIGGNVTTNIVDGVDEPIAEWMLFVDYTQFCIRACTSANSTYDAAHMCWHELDEMGCEFVMPGNYDFNGTFETCDADVAYPPGWYPTATVDGTTQFSTFAQFFTGVINGVPYTVGDTVTPSAPFSTPSSSNCATTSSISNGIALASLSSGAVGTAPPVSALPGSSGASGTSPTASNGAATGSSPSGSAPTGGANSAFRGARIGTGGEYVGILIVSLVSGLAAIAMFH